LDEPAEARLYQLLLARMPNATIVSIGHRSTLTMFHDRHLALHPERDLHRIRDVVLDVPASGTG
jgi:putative ATP-binding cassette transporter